MNIKNFFQRIAEGLHPKRELQDDVAVKFLQVLENMQEEQVSCAEFYERIDEFVEREVGSHDAEKLMPLIQEHLDACPECCDEYEALLDVLEHTQDQAEEK